MLSFFLFFSECTLILYWSVNSSAKSETGALELISIFFKREEKRYRQKAVPSHNLDIDFESSDICLACLGHGVAMWLRH